MELKKLLIMQESLRHPIAEMYTYVRKGGFFDLASLQRHGPHKSLIAITQFEDDKLYIRDGLHRSVAIHEGRANKTLRSDEYFIEHMTYAQFKEINIDAGWCTPFDPRSEVRKADFYLYKQWALQIDTKLGRATAEQFVKDFHPMYANKRSFYHNAVEEFMRYV